MARASSRRESRSSVPTGTSSIRRSRRWSLWRRGSSSAVPMARALDRAGSARSNPQRATEVTTMFVRDHDGNGGAATVAAKPDALANAGPASWTVLAYMAGDNDLEGSLLGDLREMERVGSRPGSVEIVAQIDRAPGYDTSRGDWTGSRRSLGTEGPSPRQTG